MSLGDADVQPVIPSLEGKPFLIAASRKVIRELPSYVNEEAIAEGALAHPRWLPQAIGAIPMSAMVES